MTQDLSPMSRAEAETVREAFKEAHPELRMSIDDAGEYKGVGVWCIAIVPPLFGPNPEKEEFLKLAQETLGRELPKGAVYIRNIERNPIRSKGFIDLIQSNDPSKRER